MYPNSESGNAGGLKSGYGFRNLSVGPAYNEKVIALLLRMDLTGESRPVAFDGHLNTLIQGLIDDELYDTQFDVLVNTRGGIGIGAATSKLNLIKNAHNAIGVNSPTYVAGTGYNSDGATSYLNSQYTESTAGGLNTLNNSSFFYKNSGVKSGLSIHGAYDITGSSYGHSFMGGNYLYTNIHTQAIESSSPLDIGYNCISRNTQLIYLVHVNNNSFSINGTSVNAKLSSATHYMLCLSYLINSVYSVNYFTNNTDNLELYGMGASLTQSKFLKLQSRFNTFYSAVC